MNSSGILKLADSASLLPVLTRFPEEKAALRRLFRESPSFQSLCGDYRDCREALQYWKQSTSGEAPELARVYAELMGELEEEIKHFLADDQASSRACP